ncbi:MAG: Gfo/Idh/MocA family oxidoreductase [Candidatus Bathyarchaeia archaeon]|jgi:predicted dehydrogenase
MSQKVNVGIVGTGFVQNSFHLPSYSELKLANVVAVAGIENTVEFAKRWSINKVYHGDDAIEKLCRDPNVDVVDIGIPNNLHLQTIITAAENHKHIICEKPLARNAAEAKRALDTVERYGVLNFYAENQVFIPQLTRAFDFINGGAIGKLTWLRAREAHSGPHSKWFWDTRVAGGGVLSDMGCHTIEAVRYLTNKENPVEVAAWTATLVHKTQGEDNSLVLLKFEDGSLGQCENSWSAKGGFDVRFEIYGSDGAIFIDVTRETGIKLFTAAERSSEYVVEKADVEKGWLFPTWREHETFGYMYELQHFLECVVKGQTPREKFADGYAVNQIMDAAYEASQQKKWITMKY